MRGISLLGGDLPVPEGGGGVLVEVGELDGCAYMCEQNSRGQYFTYDQSTNLCYLKSERGRLVNRTEYERYTSGSPIAGGCVYGPDDLAFPRRNWLLGGRDGIPALLPDYDTDYVYKYDDVLDADLLGSRRPPIIIINNNYGDVRRQSVREILAQAANRNPYLQTVLRGMYK